MSVHMDPQEAGPSPSAEHLPQEAIQATTSASAQMSPSLEADQPEPLDQLSDSATGASELNGTPQPQFEEDEIPDRPKTCDVRSRRSQACAEAGRRQREEYVRQMARNAVGVFVDADEDSGFGDTPRRSTIRLRRRR